MFWKFLQKLEIQYNSVILLLGSLTLLSLLPEKHIECYLKMNKKGGTRWWRSRWKQSTSISTDTSGIHLEYRDWKAIPERSLLLWLWGDDSRAPEGEDHSRKCLWRKARVILLSHSHGMKPSLQLLSPHVSTGQLKDHRKGDTLSSWHAQQQKVPYSGWPLNCLMCQTTEKDPRQLDL